MIKQYLNKCSICYGNIDVNGNLFIESSKLIKFHLLAFWSFLEIIKEFVFLMNLIEYDHILRYIFVNCSLIFPSMRYYYVVLHCALSMPFCFIWIHFWSLNVRYYLATKNNWILKIINRSELTNQAYQSLDQ